MRIIDERVCPFVDKYFKVLRLSVLQNNFTNVMM